MSPIFAEDPDPVDAPEEKTEFEELNERLSEFKEEDAYDTFSTSRETPAVGYEDDDNGGRVHANNCQFTTSDGIRFFPAGKTIHQLEPAIYDICISHQSGIYYQQIPVKTDGLIRFPETNSERVIEEINKFWKREHLFHRHNLTYKRGIILWGPPGSGKSCTVQLITADVIKRGGVVFKFGSPDLFINGVRIFREVQPNTPMVVLMEDVDSIIETYSESEVLNILDGVDQIEKAVYLATTNYPERLGARIINRPSRFDKRFKMPHPGAASRRLYFEHIFVEDTMKENNVDLDKWVKDTIGMSISHLKELFIAVCILGDDYKEAIKTLRTMIETNPKSSDDESVKVGFNIGACGDDGDMCS